MKTTTQETATAVFAFDHSHDRKPRELAALLGGKGAGLAEMTSVLGLPVPPGFTLALPLCTAYRSGGWPESLDDLVDDHLSRLEVGIGRRFGDPDDPLLLAVRSGAPRSMPGMLDTVLNLGLNEETVAGLAAISGDPAFAWENYRRFLVMFATTVLDADVGLFGHAPTGRDEATLRSEVDRVRTALDRAGLAVPDDPRTQLRAAIEAVFRSWDSPRAKAYRQREGIAEDLGTAVNVQAMVFGNRDGDSGTGVVFTRNPSTGEDLPYGDFLSRAQGEDVVAGTARTMAITAMADELPGAYRELTGHLSRLESHYREMCDVEFTVESGRLWILQTRVGKRGAVAAVRAAVEMVRDPAVGLSRDEAVERVPAEVRAKAREEVLAAGRAVSSAEEAVTTGLGASPGRVRGAVVLSADAAADADGDVILVRPETSPEDVHGMSVAVGILTSTGGLVSHAAVVARGWGIPAVVGADALHVGAEEVRDADGCRLFGAGDTITVDGTSGEVWLGDATADAAGDTEPDNEIVARLLPHLREIEAWAAG